jgi:hypothetical protein
MGPRDLRVARECWGCSGCCEIGGGEVVVVDGDGGVEDAVAVGGDAVEPGPWDFGDEAVAAELDDEPGDALATAVGYFDAVGLSGVEPGGEVVVAESGDGVFASDDGSEQGEVGWADGVEASDVTAMVGSRSAQGIEGWS